MKTCYLNALGMIGALGANLGDIKQTQFTRFGAQRSGQHRSDSCHEPVSFLGTERIRLF